MIIKVIIYYVIIFFKFCKCIRLVRAFDFNVFNFIISWISDGYANIHKPKFVDFFLGTNCNIPQHYLSFRQDWLFIGAPTYDGLT